MDQAIIRQAVPTDAEDIAAVHVTTWQYAYRGLLPDELLTGLSTTLRAERWRMSLSCMTADSAVWVAEVDGKIIGFCHVGPSRDEDADPTTGEFYAVYVDPSFMGQGIGTALMSAGHRTLRELGRSKAKLWVLVDNERCRSFYERGGWRADGATKTDEHSNVSLHTMRYCLFYTCS